MCLEDESKLLHSWQTWLFCLAIVRECEVRLLSTYTFTLLTASHHILEMGGNLISSDEQEKTLLMELVWFGVTCFCWFCLCGLGINLFQNTERLTTVNILPDTLWHNTLFCNGYAIYSLSISVEFSWSRHENGSSSLHWHQ